MASENKTETLGETEEKITYHGSCHCNAIRFRVSFPKLETQKLIECNCSICTRNGYLFIYVPPEDFTFTKGSEEILTKYRFNTRQMVHHFCPTCGTSTHTLSQAEEYYFGWSGVNVRTFADIDLSKLERQHVDG